MANHYCTCSEQSTRTPGFLYSLLPLMNNKFLQVALHHQHSRDQNTCFVVVLPLFRCSFVVASFGGSEAGDLQSKNTEQSLRYSEWILEIYWELYKRTQIRCSRSEQLSIREFPRRCDRDLLPSKSKTTDTVR